MQQYSMNLHCRISKSTLSHIQKVCEIYDINLSIFMRAAIHQMLLSEQQKGNIRLNREHSPFLNTVEAFFRDIAVQHGPEPQEGRCLLFCY